MLLEPILMLPSYRYGRETPWGGENLRQLYGKYGPGNKLGESLEISTLPGLESCAPDGRMLTDLIDQYGEALLGTKLGGAFPFVIKLIDAKESQSLHVHFADQHSDDTAEGLFILSAADQSQIVLGLQPETTLEALKSDIENEGDISKHLHAVTVQAGDSFIVPSGVIHSIGGILLYYIQHPGNATHRLYDWNRLDQRGRKRTLSADEIFSKLNACMAQRATKCQPTEMPAEHCTREMLMSTPDYSLLQLKNCVQLPFSSTPEAFSVITCLSDAEIQLSSGKKLYLAAGQTVLIPAMTYEFFLTGHSFLLARPQV